MTSAVNAHPPSFVLGLQGCNGAFGTVWVGCALAVCAGGVTDLVAWYSFRVRHTVALFIDAERRKENEGGGYSCNQHGWTVRRSCQAELWADAIMGNRGVFVHRTVTAPLIRGRIAGAAAMASTIPAQPEADIFGHQSSSARCQNPWVQETLLSPRQAFGRRGPGRSGRWSSLFEPLGFNVVVNCREMSVGAKISAPPTRRIRRLSCSPEPRPAEGRFEALCFTATCGSRLATDVCAAGP